MLFIIIIFFFIKIMLTGAEAKPCVSHIKNKQKKY